MLKWVATGALTVTFTVAVEQRGSATPTVMPLSHTEYVKLAGPLKFTSGVYVTLPLVSATRPWVLAVAVTAVTVSVWLDSFAGPGLSLVVRSEDGKVSGVFAAAVFESSKA